MRNICLLPLFLLPVACGGGVTSDPEQGEPPLIPPIGSAPSPTTVKSLICAGAAPSHADDAALWYTERSDLIFLRHDGSSTIVHHSDDPEQALQVEVGAAGDHVVAIVRQAGKDSHLYWLDRQSHPIASLTVTEALSDLRVGEQVGAFKAASDGASEGQVWDGENPPQSLASWIPIAPPRTDGWVPVRDSWEFDAELGFRKPDGSFVLSPTKGSVFAVDGQLVSVDESAWKLWIAAPSENREVSLASFGVGDEQAPHIRQVREEGWVSLQRSASDPEVADVLL